MHNGKTVWADWVSCGAGVLMNRWWCFEMFLVSVSKCPARFPNIFFWVVDLWALVFVNDPTFLELVVFVLGGHEHGFYGVCTF